MLTLYKKFIPSEKKSFSLSNVCLEDLGEDKIEYEGDLGELYRHDPTEFYRYSLQDVWLLKKLDDKHDIIGLAVLLARRCGVRFSDVTGQVKPIEMRMMKFLHTKGIVLPDKKENIKESFQGAIVYDTIPGKKSWAMTVDLGSLYPSTIRMLGMSPETMMFNVLKGYEGYIDIMTKQDTEIEVQVIENGVETEILIMNAREMEEVIRQEGLTISAEGIIFSGEVGLLAEFVAAGENERILFKKKKAKAYAAQDTKTAEKYDRFQKVQKIGNNSVYGATGEASFRFFDLRLSKSITKTAQVISKFQANRANELVEQIEQEEVYASTC